MRTTEQRLAPEMTTRPAIHLADYPNIRLLFWGAPNLEDADDETAFLTIDREWRWINWDALAPNEKRLIDRLALEIGSGWIGAHHVQA